MNRDTALRLVRFTGICERFSPNLPPAPIRNKRVGARPPLRSDRLPPEVARSQYYPPSYPRGHLPCNSKFCALPAVRSAANAIDATNSRTGFIAKNLRFYGRVAIFFTGVVRLPARCSGGDGHPIPSMPSDAHTGVGARNGTSRSLDNPHIAKGVTAAYPHISGKSYFVIFKCDDVQNHITASVAVRPDNLYRNRMLPGLNWN